MRIPTERPTGLLRLLYHRPDREERELRAALTAASETLEASPGDASEGAWDEAFRDYASYLANVWMPRHPVRAAIEAWQQERKDRHAGLDELKVLGQQPPATPISPDYGSSIGDRQPDREPEAG